MNGGICMVMVDIERITCREMVIPVWKKEETE